MTPSTLQRIGEIYLALNYGPAPLTKGEVESHQREKIKLYWLCRSAIEIHENKDQLEREHGGVPA